MLDDLASLGPPKIREKTISIVGGCNVRAATTDGVAVAQKPTSCFEQLEVLLFIDT